MTVTIKDVAKVANVNPSTVSRVIADSPRISEYTKRKVRQVMEELGYHPNLNARSLVSNNASAIGIIMPSSVEKAFQNPFFANVLGGISNLSHEKHYSLYMSTGATQQEIYSEVVKMVEGRRVDGIILLYSRANDPITNYLVEKNFPFVVIGKPYNEEGKSAYVDNDNFGAAKEITEHFIKNGHRLIGFIGGSPELIVTMERLNGYKKALENANIPVVNEYIVHTEFHKEGGKGAIAKLMSLKQPPTALIVTDDLIGFGVLGTLQEMGIKVPEDICIFSFNNIMLTELTNPPLSSVDINIDQLGYNATDSLIKLISNTENVPKKQIIPHQLIVRESSNGKVINNKLKINN